MFQQTLASPTRMLILQKEYALDASQMYRAAQLIDTCALKSLPSGNVQVKSLSRPGQFHQINPSCESCNCEHAGKGFMCIHLIAWVYIRRMSNKELAEYQTRCWRLYDSVQDAQSNVGYLSGARLQSLNQMIYVSR